MSSSTFDAARQLRLIEHVLKGAEPRPEVSLAAGKLRGVHDQGTASFRGIPYALPPIGSRRFRIAEAAASWDGVREAQDFGPACPQLVSTDLTENGNTVIHEDCLTLNVWTPAADARRRPVMVWIHGGALIEGSARNSWYKGAALALRGDVVVVTIQYRLGAFGFLHLADIGGPEFAESGNLGLLDQIAALRWVRDNIAAFGGDAGNVTLFGESAGGASIALLMGLPVAQGLFHKTIVQSLSPQLGRSAERSTAVAREFMKAAGVDTVAELQALRTADLVAAQRQLFDAGIGDNTFWPTIDGQLLQQHAIDRLREPDVPAMPLMIGTTLDEMRFWTEIEDVPLLRKPAPVLQQQLHAMAGVQAGALSTAYRLDSANTDDARLQLAGDAVFRMPSIRMAEHLSRRQPVWMYLFTYRSTSAIAPFQSAHAMELPFLFGALEDPSAVAFTGRLPGRTALSLRMQDAWTSFAHTGAPASPELPAWPRYEEERRATMHLGLAPQVVNDPMAEQRLAWGELPFGQRGPDGPLVEALLFEAE